MFCFKVYKNESNYKQIFTDRNTFMPEMYLKQPGSNYSPCSPFTKKKERIEKFTQTANTDYIYKNELDKACFQHDMAYGKSKDLIKRTQSDKVLKDRAFNIANNPNYDGYQRGLASEVYKFFDNKYKGSGIINEPNIWGVDLADMESLSYFNKGIKYLLCAIDLFSKYAWVIPIKLKKELVQLKHLKKY